MKLTTSPEIAQCAVVLTHPRFDRPAVHQTRSPGRPPKMVTNLFRYRSERKIGDLTAKSTHQAIVNSPDLESARESLHWYIAGKFNVSSSAAQMMASAAMSAMKGLSVAGKGAK